MLNDHYQETVTTQRLATTTGYKKNYVDNLTGVKCHIQPFEDDITQDVNTAFGKDLLMFCDVLDIIEADRVIWNNEEYRVVGLMNNFEFLKTARHMEIRIRAFKS